jgi:DNA repair protein RecO (recombination protein O)
MEVVITRLTPYKEKDYIVNALSAEGFITFRASGALGVKSKFAGKLFLYAFVDIEVKDTKLGYSLTNIESLNNIAKIFTDYNKIIALNLIGEIIQKTIKDDERAIETFSLVKNVLEGLPTTNHLYSMIYLFISNLLRLLGLGLVVDKCVSCGKKEAIIGVDYYRGGLICGNCANQDTMYLSPESIKILRYAFMIDEEQLFRHEFETQEVKELLKRIIKQIEETYNFKIITNDLLS